MPSSPDELAPQHFTPPLCSAHAQSEPTPTAVTPLVSPTTSTGAELVLVLPLPNVLLIPQHESAPPVRMAQLRLRAEAILVTSVVRPTTWAAV